MPEHYVPLHVIIICMSQMMAEQLAALLQVAVPERVGRGGGGGGGGLTILNVLGWGGM